MLALTYPLDSDKANASLALGSSQAHKEHLHGLVSLWDMLEIKAISFYDAIGVLNVVQNVVSFGFHEEEAKNNKVTAVREEFLKALTDLELSCNALGAKFTVYSIVRLRKQVEDDTCTYKHAACELAKIRERFRDQLEEAKLFGLNSVESEYFEPKSPHFGTEFAQKFKTDGVFEIDEAAKCLALGRPTACVFHLMRAMEVSIRALARCLQIPDPVKPAERNWGEILKRVWVGITGKWPTTADRARGEGALFESLHASLDAVKNPWRNGTMHVEKKYTDDEAQHIFVAVKGFMKKLADRMDEEGKPFA